MRISADPLLVVHVVLSLVFSVQDEIIDGDGLIEVLLWCAPFSLEILAVEEVVITSWLLKRGLLLLPSVIFMEL